MPTKEQCLELLQRYQPDWDFRHVQLVGRIARFLAEKLCDSGEDVNVKLAASAGLLHDIGRKPNSSNVATHHSDGAKILRKEGFPEIAQIAEKHALLEILINPPSTWEEKIVFYADKRATDNKIVSLQERFDYFIKRYGSLSAELKKQIERAKPKVLKLEKEIFNKLKIDKDLRELHEEK